MTHWSSSPAFPDSGASCDGVGLLECLMVCALLGVLIMLMPHFAPIIDRVRVNLACSEFHQAILVARAEAIRRQTRVDLVPARAADWRSGWVVLIDANNNQALDPGELVIHRSGAPDPHLVVEVKLRDARGMYLAFGPSGRPRSANSASVPQIGSLLFSVGAERRRLVMSFLGRVRVCDPERDPLAC